MRFIYFLGFLSISAFGFQDDFVPPQIIRNPQLTNEVWLSLSVISWENGELVVKDGGMSLENMLSEYTCNRLRGVRSYQAKRLAKANAEPCVAASYHVPLADNFHDVLQKSKFIFTAVARHVEHGFLTGELQDTQELQE